MSRQRRGFCFVSRSEGSNPRFDSEEADVKFTFKSATRIYIVTRPQEPDQAEKSADLVLRPELTSLLGQSVKSCTDN